MKTAICVLSLLFLTAACDTAGPGFGTADRVEVSQDGSRFTLRRRGSIVEAIRTNSEWLPKFQDVAPKAAIATQMWTGCKADWVMGDPAMMWIGLACDGVPAPKMPTRDRSFYCDFTLYTVRNGVGEGDLFCEKT